MSNSHTTEIKQEEIATADPKPSSTVSVTSVHSRLMIILSLLALYLLWGGTYLGMRFALQGFPPFIMAAVRQLSAGVILYLFLRARGNPRPTRAQWLPPPLLGALLLSGGNGILSFPEQRCSFAPP